MTLKYAISLCGGFNRASNDLGYAQIGRRQEGGHKIYQ
jgi:hypothetical protein